MELHLGQQVRFEIHPLRHKAFLSLRNQCLGILPTHYPYFNPSSWSAAYLLFAPAGTAATRSTQRASRTAPSAMRNRCALRLQGVDTLILRALLCLCDQRIILRQFERGLDEFQIPGGRLNVRYVSGRKLRRHGDHDDRRHDPQFE